MTEFYSVYLMLCLAVAMLVAGLFFKQNWLLMISGGFWVIAGIYFLANAGSFNFIYALGWFCVALSLPLFLSYLWHHEKKEPDEIGKDDTHREYLMKSTDKLYKSRNPNRRNIDL